MNERVRELAECARCWAKVKLQDTNIGYNSRLYENLYNEKFAELIVQKCIHEIETYQIPVGNSAAGEMACEWTYDALKEIRSNIKEHFGVKL